MVRTIISLFSVFSVVADIFFGWPHYKGKIKAYSPFQSIQYATGDKLDSLNGVYVYYNGNFKNVSGRNVTSDGYNLGLKYQCVEFVKRYYYEHLNHKMPDSYGHAKDFYEPRLRDGAKSTRRNLTQYSNPSQSKPKVNDLLVYDATTGNPYGHVAIVAKVWDRKIEIIQQNKGTASRKTFKLIHKNDRWQIDNKRILGWLRKE